MSEGVNALPFGFDVYSGLVQKPKRLHSWPGNALCLKLKLDIQSSPSAGPYFSVFTDTRLVVFVGVRGSVLILLLVVVSEVERIRPIQ